MKAPNKFSICLVGLVLLTVFFVGCPPDPPPPVEPPVDKSKTETFTFSVNGVDTEGKIFLPASYATNGNLPAVYLIDFQEQHHQIATDEFEKVINGVNQIDNFDALVVTLDAHLDVETSPSSFEEYYDVFKSMAAYVDENYTDNASRTFIGRGSESGLVLLTLLKENPDSSVFENFIATDPSDPFINTAIFAIQNDDVPDYIQGKKLHFSFSSDNNYSNCTFLIDTIENSKFPWLTFESKYYPDNIYENTYPISFAEGLKFVFDN